MFGFKRRQHATEVLGDLDYHIPTDMLGAFAAQSQAASQAHPGWVALSSAHYDAERGSLQLLLGCGDTLTLAVPTGAVNEQLVAMPTLGPTRVRLSVAQSQLAVIATCDDWVIALCGYPALQPA